MSSQRGASCNTCVRTAWTALYGLTWLLLVLGTVLYHRAVGSLVGPVKDLPANLARGFDEELGFDRLAADSRSVRDASAEALQKCGATVALCEATSLPTNTMTANTTDERLQIKAAFDSSLSVVEKVANDPYFGIDDLKETADNLRSISAELDRLDDTQGCRVTNQAYCDIYKSSDQLVAGADDAKAAVDGLTESDVVQTFEDNADRLTLLHALPYVLLVSMLFFLCFWKKDAACCCCGGSLAGCVGLVLHLVLWLTFLGISLTVVGVAWVFKFGQDRIELGAPLKGNPTLEQLLTHIETAYPGFWDIVVVPLEDPLNEFYTSAFVFLVFCVVINVYGLCLCLCRPYTDKTIS